MGDPGFPGEQKRLATGTQGPVHDRVRLEQAVEAPQIEQDGAPVGAVVSGNVVDGPGARPFRPSPVADQEVRSVAPTRALAPPGSADRLRPVVEAPHQLQALRRALAAQGRERLAGGLDSIDGQHHRELGQGAATKSSIMCRGFPS